MRAVFSLDWGQCTRARTFSYPGWDSNPHCFRSERNASCRLGYLGNFNVVNLWNVENVVNVNNTNNSEPVIGIRTLLTFYTLTTFNQYAS